MAVHPVQRIAGEVGGGESLPEPHVEAEPGPSLVLPGLPSGRTLAQVEGVQLPEPTLRDVRRFWRDRAIGAPGTPEGYERERGRVDADRLRRDRDQQIQDEQRLRLERQRLDRDRR